MQEVVSGILTDEVDHSKQAKADQEKELEDFSPQSKELLPGQGFMTGHHMGRSGQPGGQAGQEAGREPLGMDDIKPVAQEMGGDQPENLPFETVSGQETTVISNAPRSLRRD